MLIRLMGDADLKWWIKAKTTVTKSPFQGSHMFSFENPKKLAEEINGILNGTKLN